MKNIFIGSCAILLLIFTSCENDFVQDITKEHVESPSKTDHDNSDNLGLNAGNDEILLASPEDENTTELTDANLLRDDAEVIEINSLHLDCLPDSKFIVRATYNDQNNSISFEYFDNSANQSTIAPVAINWEINGGRALAGLSAENDNFVGNEYVVRISIDFDDSTTFEDEFCLNIDKTNPTAFAVCSEHETTVGCDENSRGGDKRALVVVDVAF